MPRSLVNRFAMVGFDRIGLAAGRVRRVLGHGRQRRLVGDEGIVGLQRRRKEAIAGEAVRHGGFGGEQQHGPAQGRA